MGGGGGGGGVKVKINKKVHLINYNLCHYKLVKCSLL